MRKTQDSGFKSRSPRILWLFRVSLSTSCILSLSFIFSLLIIQLWYVTPVVDADEAEERRVYIINPGDQLSISVVGHALTTLSVVRPDGMITYPVAGDVKAAGLTINELSVAISKRLSALDFYEDPQVTVQLQKSEQENIYIIGHVMDPGLKRFARSASVIEALAAAGGPKSAADLANAKIFKWRKETIPVDLSVLSGEQDVANDELMDDRFMLEDGDVLVIPSSVKTERITIIGYVNMPGQYSVWSSVTLIETLAIAGGPLPTADLKNIKIIKPDGSVLSVDATRSWAGMEQKPNSANSSSSQTENDTTPVTHYVEPGDSVVVLKIRKVNILGAVEKQGQFGVDGEIDIMEALTLAGITKNSNSKSLRIIRSTGERLTVDASEIWKRQGPEAEIRLAPGDTLIVPTAFKINWNLVNISVLILSGLYAIFK